MTVVEHYTTFGLPPDRETRGVRAPWFARQIVYRGNDPTSCRAFQCGSHPRTTIYGWTSELCRKCYVDVWNYFRPRGARIDGG